LTLNIGVCIDQTQCVRNTKPPDCYLVLSFYDRMDGWDGSISVVDGWGSNISVVDGWGSSVSMVDCWGSSVSVDGLSLGVGVGGWGVCVFHDGMSLNLDMFDDWLSEDLNFVWDWDGNWFLDIDGVGVDRDLSWVVVNFVEEGGGDSNTWSEDLWFVDDRGVSSDLVLGSVVDCALYRSGKVWDWLSYMLLHGGVVTLHWDAGLNSVVLDWSWVDSVVDGWGSSISVVDSWASISRGSR